MNPVLFKAIVKFCTTNQLFTYFHRRYNDDQMKQLNNVVKIKGKIRTLQLSSKFLKDCITKRVSPSFITKRIAKSQARHSPSTERAFLNDEIGKNLTKLNQLHRIFSENWSSASKFFHFLIGFDSVVIYPKLINENVNKWKQNIFAI